MFPCDPAELLEFLRESSISLKWRVGLWNSSNTDVNSALLSSREPGIGTGILHFWNTPAGDHPEGD
jgi:hypothetical protein